VEKPVKHVEKPVKPKGFDPSYLMALNSVYGLESSGIGRFTILYISFS
jgi:hypothetical protein